MMHRGIYKGIVKSFNPNNPNVSGQFFDLHKSFRDIANELNVSYFDACCPTANANGLLPVGFNAATSSLSYFNSTTGTVVTIGDAQSTTEITAHAGGGQGSAVALSAGFNEVIISATAGDSVKLPTAAEGLTVIVKNDGATAIDVFPFTADTIDDGTVNVAVSVVPGSVVTFRAVSAVNWESDLQARQATSLTLPDGTVGALAIRFGADINNGFYGVSDTQLGVAVEGVLVAGFNTTGIFTDHVTEQTSGFGISLDKNTIQKRTATAVNITGSILAAAVAGGLITSTSAATVTATLDTATAIGTQIGAVQGTTIDFIVDNIAGSNIVTVAVNTGITAVTAVITGGATLTVAAGAAAQFRLYFTSATVAKLARIF